MSEAIGVPEACPGPDLLLLLAHGADTLDADDEEDAEAVRVAKHVAGCARCAARAKALATSLAAPPPPFDPLELLPAIKARLAEAAVPDAASAAESDALAGAVKLRCTFCRGGLAKSQGVYCARCLAPHHGDCFGEHGRCAAPGCDGREVVSARAVVAPPARRRPRGLLVLAAAALAGGGALAALRAERRAAPPVRPTATPGPTATPAPAELLTRTYDVADLVTVSARPAQAETDGGREVQRRLESQQITLDFDETPLAEAVAFFRDITGLNVHLAADLDGALPVTLRLRNVPLGAAVDAVCAQVGASAEYRDEALTFSSAAPGGETGRFSAEWLPPPAASDPDAGRRAPEALLALVSAELGPDATVEVAQRTLVVTGGPAVHAAAVALLDRLRLRSLPPELAGAWFRPLPAPAGDPWLDAAREHLAGVEGRKVTLNFPGTPLAEVFTFLGDIGLPPARLDGPAPAKAVELRVHDVAARSALLLAAKSVGLRVDVDRRGLAFRATDRPPLEVRLREAARRALAERTSDEPEPAVTLTAAGPLAELLTKVADLGRTNLVVERGVDAQVRASLDVKDAPVGQALDRLLAPLGLGVRRSGAVLCVVPRAAATETAERVERLAAALAAPLPAGLDGGSVADLASRVASTVGAEVHLGDGARASRARLRLPAGATVREALDLATHQAGLRWATAWSEDALLVALDGEPDEGPLEAGLHTLVRASPWPEAPAGAARGEVEARGALLAALRAVAALAPDPRADLVERTARAVDEVRRARERLEDLLAGLSDLRLTSPVEGRRDALEEVLRARQEQVLGLARVRRLMARQAAEVERERRERDALVEDRGAAQARVDAAPGDGAALERLRGLDQRLDEFDERRDVRTRQRSAEERDLRLEEARLQSAVRLQRGRLRELGGWPGEARARREALARLDRGEAWSAVVPGSWRGWSLRQGREAERRFEAGLDALDLLGATLDPQLRVAELLEEGRAARAGVAAGATLVGVRAADAPAGPGAAPARLTELADALGALARSGAVRRARVAFRAGGQVVEVEVDVTLDGR